VIRRTYRDRLKLAVLQTPSNSSDLIRVYCARRLVLKGRILATFITIGDYGTAASHSFVSTNLCAAMSITSGMMEPGKCSEQQFDTGPHLLWTSQVLFTVKRVRSLAFFDRDRVSRVYDYHIRATRVILSEPRLYFALCKGSATLAYTS
jgi:hypothetical protein